MPWLCDDPGGAGRCVGAVCLCGDGARGGRGRKFVVHERLRDSISYAGRGEKMRPGLAGALVRRQTGLEVLSKGKGTRSLVWACMEF